MWIALCSTEIHQRQDKSSASNCTNPLSSISATPLTDLDIKFRRVPTHTVSVWKTPCQKRLFNCCSKRGGRGRRQTGVYGGFGRKCCLDFRVQIDDLLFECLDHIELRHDLMEGRHFATQ